MSLALPAPRVLGDAVPGGLARDVALVVGGAGLTSLAAQVSIPLPVTPVPVTLQTLAVLLVAPRLAPCAGSPRCSSTCSWA